MRENPVYQFDDESSVGVDTVPTNGIIVVKDYRGFAYDKSGAIAVLKVGNAGLTSISTIEHFLANSALWIEFDWGSTIPDETNHKGESLSTVGGIKGDTAWTRTLTTPSQLYADLVIPNDPDVNHILAGPFDTMAFVLDVPAGTTVTIV